MLVDGSHMLLDALNLDFERLDALRKFVLRQRAKVLPDELAERVARPGREEIIVVHQGQR